VSTIVTGLLAVAPAGADFSNDNGWVVLVKAVAIIVFLLVSVLLAIWFERKVVARMQIRPGPNVHGPFGYSVVIAFDRANYLLATEYPTGTMREEMKDPELRCG
jgi:hypothetical protein